MLRWLALVLLTLTVVVAGPTEPAQALVKPPAIDGERLLGGVVKTGKGVTRMGKVPGPVGAILTVGQMAWWAYNESDMKVHAPQPGGSVDDWLTGVPYPSSAQDAVMKAHVTQQSGRTVTVELECVSGWTTHPQNPAVYICSMPGSTVPSAGAVGGSTSPNKTEECKNTTTNVITQRSIPNSFFQAGSLFQNNGSPGSPKTSTFTFCQAGEVLLGFRFDAGNRYDSSYWVLQKPFGWGTLSQGVQYPSGTVQFQTAVIDATCKNSATGAVQHLYVTSDWGSGAQLDLPSCKQRLGDDWYGTGVKVIPMDPEIDDVPIDPEIWPDWDVPDFIPEEWTEEPATPEEDADPCFGSKKGCGLSVEIDGEPVFPPTTTRTKIETLIGTQPDRVACKWGTRSVEWKYCIPLLGSFDSPTGSTNLDPTTPDTGTGIETAPTTGKGTQSVPTEAQSCIAQAFSWNPVDWVFVPVKCVLTWAFVPTAWPNFGAVPNPLPAGWLPSFPSLSGGSCGVVNMPSLNLGPLLSASPGGELFNTCDWAAARNVTYYGTLALMLVVVGTRAYRAVMNALGMAVEGTVV